MVRRSLPLVLVVAAALVVSFMLLSKALKTLPIGTAYTVWTGIGAMGTVQLGILLFREDACLPRLACIAMIIGGVIGLKWLSPH